MRIVSLVNSGESLEKTVALIMTAYESNLHFYSSFDEVLVFYSNNIKKSKNDDKIIGTVKSLFDSHLIQLIYNYSQEKDLLKIKYTILDNLHERKRISNRQKNKLANDEVLFLKLITNMSWLEVFPNLEKKLIEKVSSLYKNVRFINMCDYPLTKIIEFIPHFQSFGKIYFYDFNGNTVLKKVNKISSLNKLENVKKNSIYYTFNVYIFIMIIFRFLKYNNDIIFGYRKMKNTYRKSYYVSINYVLSNYNNTIIEPRNFKFNEKLSKWPIRLGDNVRLYNVTVQILKEFIENLQLNVVDKDYKVNKVELNLDSND